MESFALALRSRHRWALVALAAASLLAIGYFGMGMVGYVQSFVGVVSKMFAAAYLAFVLCRYVDKIDLSSIDDQRVRAEVAKSRAVIMAAAIMGAAIGA